MNDNGFSDSLPLEWLAGYADGELDAERAAQVEQWLMLHPEAMDWLRAQESFSTPEFREAVQIPLPDDEKWIAVRQGIADRINAPVERKPRSLAILSGVIAFVTAASVLFVLLGLRFVNTEPNEGTLANLPDSIAPLAVATDDDVEIVSMLDRDASLLLVGYHPMPEAPTWAEVSDVVLEWVEPDSQGFWPDMPREWTPSPMILMPQPRGR